MDIFPAEGKLAATWEREGHTCILIGDGVPDAKLAELAGWQARAAPSGAAPRRSRRCPAREEPPTGPP